MEAEQKTKLVAEETMKKPIAKPTAKPKIQQRNRNLKYERGKE